MKLGATDGLNRGVDRRRLISGGTALGVTAVLLPSMASASSGGGAYEGSQGAPNPDVQPNQFVVSGFGPSAIALLAEVTNIGGVPLFMTVRFFKQPGSSNTLGTGSLTYLGEHSKTVNNGSYWSEVFVASVPPEIGLFVARVFVGAGATQWSTQMTYFLNSTSGG